MTTGSTEQRLTALEAQMQEIRNLLLQTAQQQNQTSANIDRLEQRQNQTSANIDRLERSQEQTNQLLQNFIREWSRVNANQSEIISRNDAATEANREVLRRLTNTLENTNTRLNDAIDYLRRDMS